MTGRTSRNRVIPFATAGLVFAIIAAAVTAHWLEERRHAHEALHEETAITASQSALRLEEFIETRLRLATVVRGFFEDGQFADREAFIDTASAIHDGFEAIVAIRWVDPDGVIRWVAPEGADVAVLGRDLVSHPVVAPVLQRSRITGRPASSPPLDMNGAGRIFETYVPIETAGGHAGWIGTVMRIEPMFATAMAGETSTRYVVTVRDDDRDVFLGDADGERVTAGSVSAPVAVGDRTWELTLTPRATASSFGHGVPDHLILYFGLLVGIVAAVLTWLRLQSRARIEASEARYRGIVEELPDLVCRFRPDTTITFVNEGYASYFGRDADALLGKSFLELIPEDRHAEVREHLASIDAEHPVRTVEHEVLGPGGEIRWQRWRDRALFDDSGTIVEFQSIGVDITSEKQAERSLRASEGRYRVLLESVSDGIAIHDADGRIIEVNDRLCDLAGLESAELLGGDLGRISASEPPYSAPGVRQLVEDVRATGQPRTVEWRAVRGDDAWWWAELRLSRVDVGREQRVVASVRDVSERKALEELLRQSQKLQAVGTLSAGVAHDFNNVITAVLGFSETASLLVEDREEALLAMNGIRRACEQAAGVTRALLTFSRGGGGSKGPLLVEQSLRDAIGMLHHMMPASISLRRGEPPAEPLWIEADDAQIQQVLVNLAINARDAMPDGGAIDIACRHLTDLPGVGNRGHGIAVVTVSDTGTGMSEDVRSRAVEPFFTTKPREQGTGLGLAVVHGIVTDHGGVLRIDSAEGRGTAVSIALPCCASLLGEETGPHHREPEPARGEAVLVVEDNEQVRALISRSLGRAGYDVIEAADGVAGVEAFEARARDVRALVVDVDLPRLSGPDCVRTIRAVAPGVPVLMISGLPDASRSVPRSADIAFLRKPFRIEELKRRLAEMISASRVLDA